MDEKKAIETLRSEGFDNIYAYEAEPGEVDENHQHDFDTKLIIIKGEIQIISSIAGATTNMSYKQGSEVFTPRHTIHAAKVGSKGCRYIVAEKH